MTDSQEHEKRLAESADASANPPAKPVDMGKPPSQLGGDEAKSSAPPEKEPVDLATEAESPVQPEQNAINAEEDSDTVSPFLLLFLILAFLAVAAMWYLAVSNS